MATTDTVVSPADRRRLLAILLERRGIEVDELRRIPRRVGTGPWPLSFAQQRLWVVEGLQQGGSSYHISAVLRLRGRFEPGVLEQAVGEVVRRHEILRTSFRATDGEAVQVISARVEVPLPVVDLSQLPAREGEDEVLELATAEVKRPFDLGCAPLLRMTALRLSHDQHVVILVMHHIVSDGWSMSLLVRELMALYGAFRQGAPSPLGDLPLQYADFACWQREALAGEVLDAQMSFWRAQLEGVTSQLDLPTDRPRSERPSGRGGHARFQLPSGLVGVLRQVAAELHTTLFTVLLAAWQAFLHRYTGAADVVVGVPIANRVRVEIEPLIGFFVNTLAIRTGFPDGDTVSALLGRVRETVIEAQAHQDLPFESLVSALKVDRADQRTPLLRVMFTWQNTPRASLELPGVEISPVPIAARHSKFDLNLIVHENDGALPATFEYDSDLFDHSTLERWSRHLLELMHGLAEAVSSGGRRGRDLRVEDLPLVTVAERAQLVREWSRSARETAPSGSIDELFAAQVAVRPDAVAVCDGDRQLSYAELDRRANGLARRLRELGVGAEVPVGLYLDRSVGLVIAMLGVLKAGGAYVPLDPGYPRERLRWMLDDSGVRVVVTDDRGSAELPQGAERVLRVAEQPAAAPEVVPRGPARGGSLGGESLAYVMYTSGSTGRPKGVAVAHRGVARLVENPRHFELGPSEVVLHLASPAFDASTLEVWGALLRGGRLVVAPQGPSALEGLGRRIAEARVTTLWLTAGLFHQVVETDPTSLEPLRQLLAGGDALSPLHVRSALERLGGTRLINGYGPTENTTFTSCCRLAGAELPATTVPIGTPVPGTRVYLLDRRGAPVPIGVAGELVTGGHGLARGYLGRPALTAEKFTPSPFAGDSDPAGARLYRTGDRACWWADGRIEFLGRRDGQIKIRGFRIELGEIEAALAAHPAVRQAAVIVRAASHDDGGSGEKRLAAFLIAAGTPAPSVVDLRAYLGQRLPAYMVPAEITLVPELPLTANGKVDRRALAGWVGEERPAAGSAAPVAGSEGWASPSEELLGGIWAELLGLEEVSREADFFAVGGHSLSAMRLVSRIRDVWGVELPLRTVFERPTIGSLAAHIDAERRAGEPAAVPRWSRVDRGGRLPLSLAQHRLWILDRLSPGSSAYHIPQVLRLMGDLDAGALAAAVGEVVRRHESLRSVFDEVDGEPCQRVTPEGGVGLARVDLAGLPAAARRAEAGRLERREALRPFDLRRGPVLRVMLVRLARREHLLLVTLHHIVGDGWSMGVLARELGALYEAAVEGRPSPLPELEIQYADYAVWQRRWLSEEVLERQLDYWRQRLSGLRPLELPLDRPRPGRTVWTAAEVRFAVPSRVAEAVVSLGRREGMTLYMTLLAAFAAVLGRHSGQQDVAVGSPVANRDRSELEPLVGFLVNTLVLRLDLGGRVSFLELLRRARSAALEAYAHRDVPFERVVEALEPEREAGRSPLFQVALSVGGGPEEAPRLGDLEVVPEGVRLGQAKFELSLTARAGGAGLMGALEYAAELFDRTTVERLVGHWRRALGLLAEDPERAVSSLELLSAGERWQLLGEWRGSAVPRQEVGCVHHLFEEQAARRPDATAVWEGDRATSYGELEVRANRLARALRRRGVGPEVRVALGLERSTELLVAMLAVAKAGGAYVPLDPEQPAERLEHLLRDSGARWLVTRERLAPGIPSAGVGVLSVDGDGAVIAGESGAALGVPTAPSALAYVIYTSGSTGRPKGVAVTHGSLMELVSWHRRAFAVGAAARATQVASAVFDASVWEVWPYLSAGASVEVVDEAVRHDPAGLRDLWLAHGTTHAFVPTPLAEVMLDLEWSPGAALEVLLTGGDRLRRRPPASVPWRAGQQLRSDGVDGGGHLRGRRGGGRAGARPRSADRRHGDPAARRGAAAGGDRGRR